MLGRIYYVRKKDTRSWSVDRKTPYQQWLLDRVREVKLPYKLTDQEPLGESVPKEPTLDTKSRSSENERRGRAAEEEE